MFQALNLCALEGGENAHRYHSESDQFLDKVQSEMSRELVQKVSPLYCSVVVSNHAQNCV